MPKEMSEEMRKKLTDEGSWIDPGFPPPPPPPYYPVDNMDIEIAMRLLEAAMDLLKRSQYNVIKPMRKEEQAKEEVPNQ